MSEQDKSGLENPQDKYEPDNIKKKPKGDFLLKVVSVLLAVLIWFWVVGFESQISQRVFSAIPIKIENFNDMKENYGYSIIGNTEYIDVTLQGKYSDLNKVKDDDIYAYIDLKNVSETGNIILPVSVVYRGKEYIQVVDQSKSETQIDIDEEIPVEIPVKCEIMQSYIEDGSQIGALIIEPQTVTVYGPKRTVEKLDYALVKLYLGTGLLERSVAVTENFVLINDKKEEIKNQYVRTDVNTIDIYVPLTATKEVSLTVNYKYGFYNDKNTQINITPDKIEVKGPPDYIKRMEDYIYLGEINEKKYEAEDIITFPILLPEEIASEITSADVEIKFIDMKTKNINLYTTKSSYFNIIPPQGFEYHIKEDKVQITVLGNPADLRHINSSSMSAVADFSALTEKGTHSVTLDIAVNSDDNSVLCIGEKYTVNVEIY